MSAQPSIELMSPATRGLLSFHLAGRPAEQSHSRTAPPDCWPALLRRYRDLASLRHDYPLILVDYGSCRGIESLTAVINGLLQRAVPRGPEGERTRRHVLRLENEIRSLVFRKEAGSLSRLWSTAADNLYAQPGLAAEERLSLYDDLEDVRSKLDVEGEVIGCGADTAERVMRHLWRRTQSARVFRTAAQLRELAIRLDELLRSDDLESAEFRQPAALRRAFGSRFDELIDFQAMSRTLVGGRSHARMPSKRRERIEWALQVLREEKFFGVEAENDRYDFAFASCTDALTEFRRRLPRMADLIKAIRIAGLELENHYRDEIHEVIFENFDAGSLTPDDIRWFPSYLVSLRERDCDAANRAELVELLSSELPIKLVFQVDHLFHDAGGRPDTLGTAAWRTQLAGMAMNLGSAFVLQTATSSLCPMAERAADGLANQGPALFCLFSPGEGCALPPFLTAAAAIESRLFPTLVYDPEKGDTWAECFSLEGNPQSELDWPIHAFSYEDEQMQAITEKLPFTAVDFLAADPGFAEALQVVPRLAWSDEMVPVVEYLQADPAQNSGRVPFVLMVGEDDRLERVAVTSAAVQLVRQVIRRWHSFQELGGINNSHARRALDKAGQVWESEKQKLMETPAKLAESAEKEACAPGSSVPTENGQIEPAPAASRDEAWIETPRCTSCNECTNRNPRMFKYNENKQAYIANLNAGTYSDLVEAAESCKVAIIHPGKPWNPDESGLAELLRRAEPFR